MSWWTHGCAAGKNATLTTTQLSKLVKQSRFPVMEVKDLYKDFRTMTKTATLTVQQYCDQIESQGIESDLGQRLFSVMRKSGSDSVTFEEYLSCMDIIVNGTEEEQAELSFRLISKGRQDPITYSQFADMMRSMRKLLSFGDSEGNAKLLFAQLDSDHGRSIDMHEYKLGWRTNPQLFRWFELLTSRLTRKQGNDSEKNSFLKRLVEVERDVRECLTLLRPETERWKDEIEGLTPDNSDSEACETSLDEITVLPECPLLGQQPVLLASQRLCRATDLAQMSLLTTKLQAILFKLHELKGLLKGEKPAPEVHRAPSTLQSTSSTAVSWCDENWTLAINALQGIHKAVKMTEWDAQPNAVSVVDQKRKHVIIPLSLGSDACQKVYKFNDYSPQAFERLRQLFGISAAEYLRSLAVDRALELWMEGSFQSLEGFTVYEGREGFAYYSEDGKYVLKATAKEEFKLIRRRMKDYFQYLTTFPNSLLSRIYGLHKLRYKKKGQPTTMYLVSTSNLLTKAYEVAVSYTVSGFKHADLESDRDHSDSRICIGSARKRQLLSIIEQDCRFLQSRSLTGYRLRVGVHRTEGNFQEKTEEGRRFVSFAEMNEGGLLAETGKRLYFVGLEEMWNEAKVKRKGQKYAERMIARVTTLID
jgi:1-phosphatidylinositol-4-phosphate 5-kinase